MELTQKQTIKTIVLLLILTVVSQAIYTVLYQYAKDVPRIWIWGLEGLFFVFIATLAGAALVQAKQYAIGFSAIFASAILNIVQVGIGLTQFSPFREAAKNVAEIAPAAGAVVGLSFFIYNVAKIFLGIAAFVFGMALIKNGSKALGRLSVLLGLVAIVANSIVMMFGRMASVPSGATGVIATLLLAMCLLKLNVNE